MCQQCFSKIISNEPGIFNFTPCILFIFIVFDISIIGYNSLGFLYAFDSEGCAFSITNFDSGLYKFEDAITIIKIITLFFLMFLGVLVLLTLCFGYVTLICGIFCIFYSVIVLAIIPLICGLCTIFVAVASESVTNKILAILIIIIMVSLCTLSLFRMVKYKYYPYSLFYKHA